ncbi:MAG: hypothetical protein M3P96_15280 [Actinomycetota bacterium]|nr:hypothetical protein [Actinomycetota bacterium]
MAENRDAVREATVGFAEESRDYVNRVTDVWTDATERWVNALQQSTQQFVPSIRPEAVAVPSPKELVDASYDIAEQILGFQRQLTHTILDRFGTLASSDDQPIQEKVAQQATQQVQQAGQQGQQAGQQAQQGAQSGSGATGRSGRNVVAS